MRLLRLLKIIFVVLRFGLDEFLLAHRRTRWLLAPLNLLLFFRDTSAPRAERLRRALESLGPIFVKFGQVLSTRRDLMPTDISDELAKLQDQVPPFPSAQAVALLENIYKKKIGEVFRSFDEIPIASASVAQVHFAVLPDGREVAVKILRPGIENVIAHDVALLDICAGLMESWWEDGKRLKPREVVAEFDKHLHDELDLMREAASASQLKRNFASSNLLTVPEVYWDWCTTQVMVMERMEGIPISHVPALRAAGIDLRKLAENGVEIFYIQVFRDGFFHADMHPGNLFVDQERRLVAVDFGIMGRLGLKERLFLAEILHGFINRDYHRVAEVHFEAGYVPRHHSVENFAQAIRAIGEPIHNRTAEDISMARLLTLLFEVTGLFDMRTRPELLLLQKTMVVVEGVARSLDPKLDMWSTAEPVVREWMTRYLGPAGKLEGAMQGAGEIGRFASHVPGLLTRGARVLDQLDDVTRDGLTLSPHTIAEIDKAETRRNRGSVIALWVIAALLLWIVLLLIR